MGNIVAGTNEQTQMVIDAGMLKVLGQVLRHPKSSIQKLAAWVMSNVAAGPRHHVQQLILCNLLPVLVNLLRNVSGRAGKRVSKASVVRHKDLSSIPRAHRKQGKRDNQEFRVGLCKASLSCIRPFLRKKRKKQISGGSQAAYIMAFLRGCIQIKN